MRTPISPWRETARDSWRLATLAQAINRTNPTEPSRIKATGEHHRPLDRQRNDAERQPAIRRIGIGEIMAQARGDGIHFCLRLRKRDAGLELAHDVVIFLRSIASGSRRRGEAAERFHLVQRRREWARLRAAMKNFAEELRRPDREVHSP